jgi:hypothetical protein
MSQQVEWIDERDAKPAYDETVVVMVMRRAHLTLDPNGQEKWVLADPDVPIDLERDLVYWLPNQL